MPSFQNPTPQAMPHRRPLSLALACAATASLAACSTQELHPDVTPVSPLSSQTTSPNPNGDTLYVYVIRDDAYTQDANPVYRDLPPYRLTIDGHLATWDEGSYVTLFPNSMSGMMVAPGTHVLSLVDGDGAPAATAASVEIRAGLVSEVAFFGGPSSLRSRAFVDDPAAVPAGSSHVRLLNALSDHQPVELVQCAGDFGTVNDPRPCVATAAPIAYGDVAEMDAGPDVVGTLGWRWAAPEAGDAIANWVARPGSGSSTAFVTRIPVQVLGPSSVCPSCLFAEF